MTRFLLFEAAADGQPFGVIFFHEGVASARAGRLGLDGVPFGQAVQWVRERSPFPGAAVEVYAVGRVARPLPSLIS